MFPVDAAQNGGGKLGDGGKGDEANRDQGTISGNVKVAVGQQQNDEDGKATDDQQHAGEVGALVETQGGPAQQQRHDQIVGDHGAEGKGGDDQHAGGGGETTNISQQCQTVLANRQRQRQDKKVGIGVGQQPVAGHSDGENEDVDEEQVEGEEPACFEEVAFVYVFQHGHLELTGEEHNGEHG